MPFNCSDHVPVGDVSRNFLADFQVPESQTPIAAATDEVISANVQAGGESFVAEEFSAGITGVIEESDSFASICQEGGACAEGSHSLGGGEGGGEGAVGVERQGKLLA